MTDDALPLAEAAKRLTKPKKRRKDSPLTEIEQGMALGMSAVGLPQNKIAQALMVPKHTVVEQIQAIPDYRQTILRIRETLKLTKIQKALFLEEKLWNLADHLIDAKDAKGVDGTLRALHASEKIQQAVAGEGTKVDLTMNQPPIVDLKILLQTILNEST